jgi:hypothetical protein
MRPVKNMKVENLYDSKHPLDLTATKAQNKDLYLQCMKFLKKYLNKVRIKYSRKVRNLERAIS